MEYSNEANQSELQGFYMNKMKEEEKNTTPWKDFWSVVQRKNKTTENNRAVTGFLW